MGKWNPPGGGEREGNQGEGNQGRRQTPGEQLVRSWAALLGCSRLSAPGGEGRVTGKPCRARKPAAWA